MTNSVISKTPCVRAEWDSEARVWVATSDEVPGLATEAETIEALSAKLNVMIPELLAANGTSSYTEIPFELLAHRAALATGHA